jgi:RNA polymerase sigma-70 factor, ECF subfamily
MTGTPVPSEEEQALERDALRLAQEGDQQAFGSLVVRYQQACFRAAYLIVRDEMEAQDVAQEAFVRAYKALSTFDASRALKPWLLRITTNLALNSIRSSGRRAATTDRLQREGQRSAASPEPEAERRDEAQRVWRAVGTLSRDDQELIYLRYFLDNSEEQLATAIGRPRGTVKSRLHRALRRLRQVIERDYPDLVRTVGPSLVEEQA